MKVRIPRSLAVDVAFVVWAVVWVVVGLQVADEVRALSELSGTVIEAGVATQNAGTTLESLSSVPLVGDRVSEPSRDLTAAGRSAIESGRSSRESIRTLSTLLGVAVAVIPTVPVLMFYLPARLGWIRVVRVRREQ